MKHLLLLLALGAASASGQTLVLSDFSHFTPDYISQSFDGPWSADTTGAGATQFTIADFGLGTPSGNSGNAFIQWLGTPQDWTSYHYVNLTGFTPASNQTPTLHFYLEDVDGNNSIFTAFDLAAFSSATTNSVSLNAGAVNLSQVLYWGFAVSDFSFPSPEFAYTFDHLELSAAQIPEPGTTATVLGGLALLSVALRRRRANPVA